MHDHLRTVIVAPMTSKGTSSRRERKPSQTRRIERASYIARLRSTAQKQKAPAVTRRGLHINLKSDSAYRFANGFTSRGV
jgi:hypothetical protein